MKRADIIRIRQLSKVGKRELYRRSQRYGATHVDTAKHFTIVDQNAFAWLDGYKAARAELRAAIETVGMKEILTEDQIAGMLAMLMPVT